MAEAETQAAFARRRGVSKAAVAKWKSQGLLSVTADGLVEIEESGWRLDARPGTYRGGKTRSQKTAEVAARTVPVAAVEIRSDETLEAAADRFVAENGAPYSHAEAVRVKENFLALLRQLEFDVKSGAVVPIDVVMAGIVEQYARVRTKMLSIPTRVAPRAAMLKSADEVRALIEAEVHQALQELTLDGEGHVTLDGVRDGLRERFGSVH